MNLDDYFQRIGYNGTPEPTLACLQELHVLHPCAIPFENLSSFIGKPVKISITDVTGKLVAQERGGYCFEHNRLFAEVLREIGFIVSEHAARVVWRSPDKTQMARTHMLLKVIIDGEPWIADVGFGGLTMTAALKLREEGEQDSPHEHFRIRRDGSDHVIEALLKDTWKPMYVFDLVEQYPVDYEMANHFVSRHPDSLFIHNLMLGRATPDGRHVLQNREYGHYTLAGERQGKTLNNADELRTLLADAFGIILAEDEAQLLRENFGKLP